MAEVWTWAGYSLVTSGWDITISGTGNRIGFCGATFGSSVGVGEYQYSTWVTNDTMTVNYGEINNNKYISSTEVDTNSSRTKTLISGSVPLDECTLRISFEETDSSTATSVTRFYAYDGTTPATAPPGVRAVAFEVDTLSGGGSYLNIGKDTGTVGGAWTASLGIGGSTNKLIIADESSIPTHQWFLGVSSSPQSVGLKSSYVFRIETDYQ